MHNVNMKKIQSFFTVILYGIILSVINFICIPYLANDVAHADNTGLAALCVAKPKFAYLFSSLDNFQSSMDYSGTGHCQWNADYSHNQTISIDMIQDTGKFGDPTIQSKLMNADPFGRFKASGTGQSSATYRNHFVATVCSDDGIACIAHVVIDPDRLLNIKNICNSPGSVTPDQIRQNIDTLALFIVNNYDF